MAKFPALLLWTDAYLSDTTHLSTEEHGAYMLLLIAAWRSERCSLPDDDALLARFCRCHLHRWRIRIRPVLAPFFTISDGVWTQKRLTAERKHVEGISEKRREASAKSREAKPLKTNGAGPANAPAYGSANDPPNGPLSSTSTSTDKKETPTSAAAETPTPREPEEAAAADHGRVSISTIQKLAERVAMQGLGLAAVERRVALLVAQNGRASAVELAILKALDRDVRYPLAYITAVLLNQETERIAAVEAAKAVALEPPVDDIGEAYRKTVATLREMEARDGQEFTGAYCSLSDGTAPDVWPDKDDAGADDVAGRSLH